MTNGEANTVRACLDCGEPGAALYLTTKNENPGRLLRLCDRCRVGHDWDRFGLVWREPLPEEVTQ
jgi:hypothetical protein